MSREDAVSPNRLTQTWSDSTNTDRVRRKHVRTGVAILQNNLRWLLIALLAVLFAGAALYEVHTSVIQAKLFSAIAAKLSYSVGPGPSPRIHVSRHRPA